MLLLFKNIEYLGPEPSWFRAQRQWATCQISDVDQDAKSRKCKDKYISLIIYWFNKLSKLHIFIFCRLRILVDIANLKGCPMFWGTKPWPLDPSMRYFSNHNLIIWIQGIPKIFTCWRCGLNSLLKKNLLRKICSWVCTHKQVAVDKLLTSGTGVSSAMVLTEIVRV